MYLPPLTSSADHQSSWEYRKSLLQERIGLINADIVCLQEVSPLSFNDDFAFMFDDLGYDGVELYRKGRFRPATFWKKDKLVLVDNPQHKDRTLLTSFRRVVQDDEMTLETSISSSSNDKEYYWHILNCHLQAGKQGGRRVRQIIEGTNAAIKMAKKHQQHGNDDVDNIQLIVCGDFNGGQECGAIHYLENGSITPDFYEDGEQISSKEKILPIPPLTDVVASIHRDGGLLPPATLVVPELISYMIGNSRDDDDDRTITTAYEDPNFSEDVINRLRRIYSNFATTTTICDTTTEMQMGKNDVERWLTIINQRVGRGTEFRNAAKYMGWVEPILETNEEKSNKDDDRLPIIIPDNGILTLEDFICVYTDELRQGKFWGIAWDLASLGEPLPVNNVFRARYDRIYASQSLLPVAVLDTISEKACPNEYEPSDHLPVCASFLPRR
jgi:hypothetical protein